MYYVLTIYLITSTSILEYDSPTKYQLESECEEIGEFLSLASPEYKLEGITYKYKCTAVI